MSDKPLWLKDAEPTPIEGAYVVTRQRHHDNRGYFQEIDQTVRYDTNLPHASQVNISYSRANVVRGLHVATFGKLCTVVFGRVFDVVADVRRGSPTEGQWHGIWLDDLNCKQLYVPPNCAHGFYVAEEGTLFLYHQDGLYNHQTEWSINWLDPTLNIHWPETDHYILSDRDRNAKEWQR